MDLPARLDSSFFRQFEIRAQARQTVARVQSLQALAEHQVLLARCSPGRSCTAIGHCRLVRSVFVPRTLARAVNPAEHELRIAGVPARAGTKSLWAAARRRWRTALPSRITSAQFQAALLSARRLVGNHLCRHDRAELSRNPILVPRHMSPGSAAGPCVPLVCAGSGERI